MWSVIRAEEREEAQNNPIRTKTGSENDEETESKWNGLEHLASQTLESILQFPETTLEVVGERNIRSSTNTKGDL